MKKMDEAALKKAGAIAVVKFGKGVQVVMGTLSDNIESEMRRQMKR
jgi:phosphotransferase system IIB component